MTEINENYNNSPEGNEMRNQLDKAKAAAKKYVVLTTNELETLLAVSAAGSKTLDLEKDRDLAGGRAIQLEHLYKNFLYDKEDALRKINESID